METWVEIYSFEIEIFINFGRFEEWISKYEALPTILENIVLPLNVKMRNTCYVSHFYYANKYLHTCMMTQIWISVILLSSLLAKLRSSPIE